MGTMSSYHNAAASKLGTASRISGSSTENIRSLDARIFHQQSVVIYLSEPSEETHRIIISARRVVYLSLVTERFINVFGRRPMLS